MSDMRWKQCSSSLSISWPRKVSSSSTFCVSTPSRDLSVRPSEGSLPPRPGTPGQLTHRKSSKWPASSSGCRELQIKNPLSLRLLYYRWEKHLGGTTRPVGLHLITRCAVFHPLLQLSGFVFIAIFCVGENAAAAATVSH